MEIVELLRRPWPWWVAGPLLGLTVPIFLVVGNRLFGISPSLRHACSAADRDGAEYFEYDWRGKGAWHLALVAGILVGGAVAAVWLSWPEPVAIAARTRGELAALGVEDFSGLVPADLFSWAGLLSLRGAVAVVLGGFLVGFGAGYAGGCTSGHALSGLANLERASLMAVVAFFVGGLLASHVILPLLF